MLCLSHLETWVTVAGRLSLPRIAVDICGGARLPGRTEFTASRCCEAPRHAFHILLSTWDTDEIAIERSLVLPSRPHNASEAVSESNGCLDVTCTALAVECPATQAVKEFSGFFGASGGEQRRAGAVHEECSQIYIAALGDCPEPTRLGTGSLASDQPQPGGEVPAAGEALDVAGAGTQCGTRQKTDFGDFLLKRMHLRERLIKCGAHTLRNIVVALSEGDADLILSDVRPHPR